jgi:hypothetical protein
MTRDTRSRSSWSIALCALVAAGALPVMSDEEPRGNGVWKFKAPSTSIRGEFDNEDPGQREEAIMKRRQFVGSGLALAATWPLRGFTSVLKGVGDVPARSLAGGETVLPGSAIEALAAGLRGDVLLAGSQDYDRTRRVWNASFDKKPALIVRCTGASDVQQAVALPANTSC